MNYWWQVKRYGDDPIRVTERAAEAIKEAISRGDTAIEIKGTLVAAKAISGVEQSLERVEKENVYLLEAPSKLKPYGKGTPLFGPTFQENGITYGGAVLCNWYKKNIDRREWDSTYSKLPHYFRMDDADQSVWVAMRLPEEEGSLRPEHLILCTADEVAKLELTSGA